MLEKKYRVAILNYPLMNPNLKIHDYVNYIFTRPKAEHNFSTPLYIHIPFCNKICNFCVYSRQFVDKNDVLLDNYVESLIKEVKIYAKDSYVQSLKINAVFFGGGTPTSLSSGQLKKIIMACKDYLPLNTKAEITVECDIKNTDEEKVVFLKECGVSRISTGVQTFNPEFRKLLGLNTTAQEAIDWIRMVQKYKFDVLSIDLMYGLPGQKQQQWKHDLDISTSLDLDHMSIYELCVLAGSKFFGTFSNDEMRKLPEQEELYKMYTLADTILKEKHYNHHIIPEYYKLDKIPQFWEDTYDGYGDNLSVGASSYGYINGVNYQNLVSIQNYMKQTEEGKLPIQMVSKRASKEQEMERSILLGLRRKFVDKNLFYNQYNREIGAVFGNIIQNLMKEKLIIEEPDRFVLTQTGEYYQSDISSLFMVSTFKNVTTFKKRLSIGNHIAPEAL